MQCGKKNIGDKRSRDKYARAGGKITHLYAMDAMKVTVFSKEIDNSPKNVGAHNNSKKWEKFAIFWL